METSKNIGENELSRDEARARMKKLLTGLATVGCGYLFGGTHALFGAYPFGIAALCASGKGTLWLLAGLVIRALTLGDAGFVYIALYVLAVGMRLLVSSGIVKFIPDGKGLFGACNHEPDRVSGNLSAPRGTDRPFLHEIASGISQRGGRAKHRGQSLRGQKRGDTLSRCNG